MPSIPLLKTCCFCCTTETGTKFFAWLQMILAALTSLSVLLITFVPNLNGYPENEVVNGTNSSSINTKTITDTVIINVAISIVLYAITFFLGLFLLIAVHKRNMSHVGIWIVISVFFLIVTFLDIVIELILKIIGIDTSDMVLFISVIVSFVISTYFTWVVYSYYRQTKSGTSENV